MDAVLVDPNGAAICFLAGAGLVMLLTRRISRAEYARAVRGLTVPESRDTIPS